MNKPYLIAFLLSLALWTVIPSASAGDVIFKVFEGKPRINSPQITGNYPSTPFIFYIPTSGQRPMRWSAEKLPEGLEVDSKTGIISGVVTSKGDYTVTLKAENALGVSVKQMVIRIGDELLLTPPMGWNSWNTFGQHLTEELILQTADAMIENGMRDLGYSYINIDDFWQLPERGLTDICRLIKLSFHVG